MWDWGWQRGAGDWEDYYLRGLGPDPDLMRERRMFNPHDAELPEDEPLFYTRTQHPLLFSCQCKRCVRMHTISMEDAAFLRSIGVMWRTPDHT